MKILRDTVRIFLSFWGSYARTAEALTMHRNTVLYRVQKAEKLLGARIDDVGPELQDALLIMDWLQ